MRAIQITLTLLLTALCAAAQTQAPNAKPDTPSTGSITGRVVDENGQPLPNALVIIRPTGAPRAEQSLATDREGVFRANGLQPLAYTILVAMPAYILAPRDPGSSASPVTTYRIGDSATFTMVKGGVVTGTVMGLNGDPLVGITVRVQMVRDRNGRRLPNGYRQERLTDDRGIYRIYGLPTGTYVVMAGGSPINSYGFNAFESDAPTYAPSQTRDTAAEISIRTGEETTGVDIRYRGEPARVISGRVTQSQNIEGGFQVNLSTADQTGIPWSSSVFQQPGNRGFEFLGVPDGDYYLYARSNQQNEGPAYSDARRVKVQGADVTGIELTTRPLGSVSGRVVLEASKAPECTEKKTPPFNEISVAAWHKDDEAAKRVPQFMWSLGVPVAADPEGKFKLQSLATGEYHFIPRFVARYWYVQSILLASPAAKTAKPIDATRTWTSVKAGDRLSGLTITLAQGAASVRGDLVLQEGEQVPAKLWVYLVPLERERADDLLRFYGSAVSPEGKITLGNIAPGRYWVLSRTETEDGVAPLTKLRLPHETETRARLRREAEAAKTEIELKPCQTVADFRLPLNPPASN